MSAPPPCPDAPLLLSALGPAKPPKRPAKQPPDDNENSTKKPKGRIGYKDIPAHIFIDVDKSHLERITLCESMHPEGYESYKAEFYKYSVTNEKGELEEKLFDLEDLSQRSYGTQLLPLLGLKNTHKKPKNLLGFILADHIIGKERNDSANAKRTLDKCDATGFLCRFVNLLLHPPFIEDYFALTDAKKRENHEGQGSLPYKSFWKFVSEALNLDYDELDDDDLKDGTNLLYGSPVVFTAADLKGIYEWWRPNDIEGEAFLHLSEDFDGISIHATPKGAPPDAKALEKKHKDLLLIRRVVYENIHRSGNGESDPYNFVHAALKGTSIPFKAAYYFIARTDEYGARMNSTWGVKPPETLFGDATGAFDGSPTPKRSSSSRKERSDAEAIERLVMLQEAQSGDIHEMRRQGALKLYLDAEAQYYAVASEGHKRSLLRTMKTLKQSSQLDVVLPGEEEEDDGYDTETLAAYIRTGIGHPPRSASICRCQNA